MIQRVQRIHFQDTVARGQPVKPDQRKQASISPQGVEQGLIRDDHGFRRERDPLIAQCASCSP